MIYLISGAPRVGKSILAQEFSAERKIGWISTDLLIELLRVKNDHGIKTAWNASPQAIQTAAEWFFPYLERFVWGVNSLAEGYVIEGVDFLPAQAAQLAKGYQIHAVFLGCSQMTLKDFDQFPGRSKGYSNLPEPIRLQIVQDVPLWSEFIRQESERYGLPYFDMSGDFSERLKEAKAMLMTDR